MKVVALPFVQLLMLIMNILGIVANVIAATGSRWNSTFLSRIIGVEPSSNPTEFEILLATINGIHDRIDRGVQLNKQLCGYVDRKLSKLKASLENRYKSFLRAPESEPNDMKIVLKELHLVVKRVEVLVQKCTFIEARDQWLEVAITMANVEEDVVEMELDLAWWVSVLKIAADSNMGESELLCKVKSAMRKQETLLEKLSKELSSLQKAAKTDREDLLSRLEEVKKEGNTNSPEYVLAIYLLSRMQGGHDQVAPEVAVHLQPKNKGELLGEGAYGEVHAVTWLGNRECALKVLKHPNLDDEYRILRRCSHPHILQSLWYWKEEEKSHIIMQRMLEDLDKHVSGKKLDLHVAIDVMLQIAKAMRYLQHNKIVHRDLKPSNVLVQPENFGEPSYIHVKLADFGTAKNYLNSATFSEQTPNQGTTLYAAPEVIFGTQARQPDGTPNFPPKADVWSFSMVCYEVLSGKKPFYQESSIGTIRAKIQDPEFRPLFPQDCPDYIRSCISRCWEQSPDKRPTFSDICTRLKLAKALSLGITRLEPCMHLLPYRHPDNQGTSGRVIASPQHEAILGEESITRVLVVRSLRTEPFMKNFCFMNHDVLDGNRPNLESISEIGLDINKEWKHCGGSLRIHAASKCIGEPGWLKQIDSFLAERNSLLTSSGWLASWQVDLRIEDCRNWRTFQKVEKVNRVHVVWLLYEVFESIEFEWKHLNEILKKHEVPLQILILTNPEKDPTGEFLERNFLGKRGSLFPDVSASSGQVHFIMIPSHCLSIDMANSYQQPFLDNLPNQSSRDTLSLTQMDHRALLQSTEVIKTFSSIQKTACIISKIASDLGKKGITIPIAPFRSLSGRDTLTLSGIFTTKCMRSIWEIPLIRERTMMSKFALWESNETDHEPSHRPEQNVSLSQSFSLSIKDGRYLPFTACAAHAIVYLHLRGWTASDNSDEFDSFNSKHKKRFEEFSQESSSGILSQLWQKLSGSFDETGLRQKLQKSLKDFYIECTTGQS
ncbi:unnamed protein product [Sphagnum tenellum]